MKHVNQFGLSNAMTVSVLGLILVMILNGCGSDSSSGTLVVNGSSATITSNWQSVTTITEYGSCIDDLNKT